MLMGQRCPVRHAATVVRPTTARLYMAKQVQRRTAAQQRIWVQVITPILGPIRVHGVSQAGPWVKEWGGRAPLGGGCDWHLGVKNTTDARGGT